MRKAPKRRAPAVDPWSSRPKLFEGGVTWVDPDYDQEYTGPTKPARSSDTRSPKLAAARNALTAEFPGGMPDPVKLPNKSLVKVIQDRIGKLGTPLPSSDTILRAAGRK